jgi:hypothetical protein
MTTKELQGIYETACHAKGYTPNDGQFKIWRQTLGWCERKDLEAALVSYFTDNSGFPMPAELKPLSEHNRRLRVAQASESRALVVWLCPVCGYRRSGFLTSLESAYRKCLSHWGPLLALDAPRVKGVRPERIQLEDGQVCGAELGIVSDERVAA